MSYGRWKQGFYEIRNKEKYVGNNKPFFRSSWELRVMNYLDLNKNVIAWSSERFVIPYKLPKEMDGTGKIRRYFVDFYCEIKDNGGNIKKYLVEIKPLSQSIKPTLPKNLKPSKSYKHNAISYMVNHFKWEAATQYCKNKGYEFKVLTENDVYNMKI